MESNEDLRLLLSQNLLVGCKIQNYVIEPLDSGGQHFSSEVNKVKVYFESKGNERSYLDLIMKVMPAMEKQIQVNSKLGFQKEAFFYQLAIPEYYKIQTDHNIEPLHLFPKCYSATDKAIVLGDLGSSCYIGHKQCIDEEHCRLVLQELAKFHATGVALKLYNPDIFQAKLAAVVTPALQNANNIKREEINKEFRSEISALLMSFEGFEHFADLVDAVLKNIDEKKLPIPSEPYATLLHNDLWLGNILFKYSSNNQPLSVKFIDFQTTIYNSPARDLVYFLFTSVEKEVLKEFDLLVSFYHKVFVSYLSDLGCNPIQFTFEELMNEVNYYGPTKLKHMILLFKTLCHSSKNDQVSLKFQLQQLVLNFRDRGWL